IEATAQTRPRASRIGVVNPMSPDPASYLEFYEFAQVDVQPSFPGGDRGRRIRFDGTGYVCYAHRILSARQRRTVCHQGSKPRQADVA
ncbi:MAG: hypothetical protein KIG59_03490, partial [Muribaculaceae bacterium]|nr:hypothetical protein [Muribaculaceae bacterium]